MHRPAHHFTAVAGFLALFLAATAPCARSAMPAGELAAATVESSAGAGASSFDGVVQAVRQSILSAQVAASVVEIRVHPGEAVRAGQVLLRLDARAARQGVVAGEAQVREARAALEVAARERDRQKQLLAQRFISQGAFERAQAQFEATQAQVDARIALSESASAQSGYFIITAPYAGLVSELPVVLGDLAMPGRALVTIYDPAALRVSAMIPQSSLRRAMAPADVAIELAASDTPAVSFTPLRMQVFPSADPATHTVEVRFDLPASARGIAPGSFARVRVSGVAQAGATPRLFVPRRSVVQRAEVFGVYVLAAGGPPQLRQVRLGEAEGDRVEVLSGLSAQDRVALDPQVAARASAGR
jgi:RND family efflux transporter MFP subunit